MIDVLRDGEIELAKTIKKLAISILNFCKITTLYLSTKSKKTIDYSLKTK